MTPREAASPLAGPFALADELRRRRGRLLGAVLSPPGRTPYRVLLRRPGMTLRAYGPAEGSGPVLVLVPAPIKRAYIWDLAPPVSVVRRCLGAGHRVCLIEWTDPKTAGDGFGLEAYADRLILDCLDRIGGRPVLVGHSLGGTLAAVFSSLHPRRVRGLVLLEAPLCFGEGGGALARLVRKTPDGRTAPIPAGAVPGSLLTAMSIAASPTTFLWERWMDRLVSLGDPAALRTHLLVERWSLDELPMSGRLFADVVGRLYRDDAFMKGGLHLGGRRAAAAKVRAPALGVFDPRSRIVPPSSVLPFFAAVRSLDKPLLRYHGDTGVALRHVGVLVGRRAHEETWPGILSWVRAL